MISADKNIPTQQSKSEDWIAWYKSFPWSMSTNDKNTLFLAIWKRNGSEAANDDSLRRFLSDTASIDLTTTGIASVQEAAWSFAHGVEDVFSMSAYATGGFFVLWFLLMGFGIYQAIKNPEATGKIIGAAGRAAMV